MLPYERTLFPALKLRGLLKDLFEAWRRPQPSAPFEQRVRIRLLEPVLVARRHRAEALR